MGLLNSYLQLTCNHYIASGAEWGGPEDSMEKTQTVWIATSLIPDSFTLLFRHGYTHFMCLKVPIKDLRCIP